MKNQKLSIDERLELYHKNKAIVRKEKLRAYRMKQVALSAKEDPSRPLHRQMEPTAKAFVLEYFNTNGDERAAAMKAKPNTDLMEIDQVAKKLMKHKDVRQVLQHYAERAVHRVEYLAQQAKSEKVMLDANFGIMDRAGYTPPKEQHTHNTLVINIPDAIARKNNIVATTLNPKTYDAS